MCKERCARAGSRSGGAERESIVLSVMALHSEGDGEQGDTILVETGGERLRYGEFGRTLKKG